MQVNTVMCTVCKRWIHKHYTGVRGNLLLVVDGIRSNDVTVDHLFLTGDYIDVHDNSNTDP